MHHIYSIPVAYTVLYLFKLALGNNPLIINFSGRSQNYKGVE